MNAIESLVAMTHVPQLGSSKIRFLIQKFGSAEAAYEASAEDLHTLPGFGKKVMEGWENRFIESAWKRELELSYNHGVFAIPYTSPQYPRKLLEIPDFPVVLYAKGRIELLNSPGIAVVGTRHPTVYGAEMASLFGSHLAARQLTVVSGLARGIDTAAHRGALKNGSTIAVIGSGLGDIYPRENQLLAEEITEHGVLLSEFPFTTPPNRQNFPLRNRIVSGMTLGCLLIEAHLESGALITMEKAFHQGRPLYALPGRLDVPSFKGNHALIKTRKARLVEDASEIAQDFDSLLPISSFIPTHESSSFLLTNDEITLLHRMPSTEIGFDELNLIANLSTDKLNVLIMSLLLKKEIKELPGKIYKKCKVTRIHG